MQLVRSARTQSPFEYDPGQFNALVKSFGLRGHDAALCIALKMAQAVQLSKLPNQRVTGSLGQQTTRLARSSGSVGRRNFKSLVKKASELREWFDVTENVNRVAAARRIAGLKIAGCDPSNVSNQSKVWAADAANQAIQGLKHVLDVLELVQQYDGRDGGTHQRDDIVQAAWFLWCFWTSTAGKNGKLWRRGDTSSKGVRFLSAGLALLGLHVSDDRIAKFKF